MQPFGQVFFHRPNAAVVSQSYEFRLFCDGADVPCENRPEIRLAAESVVSDAKQEQRGLYFSQIPYRRVPLPPAVVVFRGIRQKQSAAAHNDGARPVCQSNILPVHFSTTAFVDKMPPPIFIFCQVLFQQIAHRGHQYVIAGVPLAVCAEMRYGVGCGQQFILFDSIESLKRRAIGYKFIADFTAQPF
jgi:hypothetical protein